MDRLSNILRTFNDLFGDIAWDDRDRVGELITKTIPAKVAADAAFRNARENPDDANARIEHDKVLARIVTGMVQDDAELFSSSWTTRISSAGIAVPQLDDMIGAAAELWNDERDFDRFVQAIHEARLERRAGGEDNR